MTAARAPTDRTTRAAVLTVEPIDGSRFQVSGGSAPHLVDLEEAIRCDCKDYQWNPGVDCKHLLAVRAHVATSNGSPEVGTSLPTAPDAAPVHKPRFHLYTIDDLLTLPPPTWLLAQHIPENSLAVLYGPPGAGKSFLALAWAMAIGAHQPWIQHATRWGPVVFVAAEGGSGLAQRAQAYRDSHELVRDCRIRFVREAVNLLEPRSVSELLEDVQAGIPHLKPAMFTFDTMARCMSGGDENSAQDVGRVIAAADRIRQQTAASVLLVHHTGKQGDGERGSSALRGAADCMFALKNDDGILTLECTKQKDASATEPQRLRLVPIGGSCTIEPIDGEPEPRMTSTSWKLLRELLETFEGGGSGMAGWQRVAAVPERTAYRTAKHLMRLGYVTKQGAKYVVTPAGESALKGSAT